MIAVLSDLKRCFKETFSPRLDLVDIITVSATNGPFVVREKFRKENTSVKFSCIDNAFREYFYGLTELLVPERKFGCYVVKKYSKGMEIFEDLGGEKAVVRLSEIFFLLEKHEKAEESKEGSFIFYRGVQHLFYVRDVTGVVRSVYLFWFAEGWTISSVSFGEIFAWIGGDLVFAPMS